MSQSSIKLNILESDKFHSIYCNGRAVEAVRNHVTSLISRYLRKLLRELRDSTDEINKQQIIEATATLYPLPRTTRFTSIVVAPQPASTLSNLSPENDISAPLVLDKPPRTPLPTINHHQIYEPYTAWEALQNKYGGLSVVWLFRYRLQRLAVLPARNPITNNRDNSYRLKAHDFQRPGKLKAALTQAAGYRQDDDPCENCEDGWGPWTLCVTAPTEDIGPCANCCYDSKGRYCSFYKPSKYLSIRLPII